MRHQTISINYKFPSFYGDHCCYRKITSEGIIKVYNDSIFFIPVTSMEFQSAVLETINRPEIEEEEFTKKYQETLHFLNNLS